MNISDTIIAQATPLGYSGVSIIRMSGPDSITIVKKLTKTKKIQPRKATLKTIVSNGDDIVDSAIITCFPKPRSYTGEDVVEISCHGNPSVVETIISMATSRGARLAEPGEYTKRAFLNGKIDLIQAEGIMALIASKSIESVRVQQKILTGELSKKFIEIKTRLVNVLSELEHEMDISEDVANNNIVDSLGKSISTLMIKTKELIKSHKMGYYLSEGVSVVITGKPNVGKSTLLNQIIGSERAIVDKDPGTTRDIIDCEIKLLGVPVRFFDTAGIRETPVLVEKEGVIRAEKMILNADLVLNVYDKESDVIIKKNETSHIHILNKADLRKTKTVKKPIIHISAKTGEGVDLLMKNIVEHLGLNRLSSSSTYVSSVRQKNLLKSSLTSIKKANKLIKTNNLDMPLVAYELRSSLDFIDTILGKTTADDILNNVFSKFCVGK